MYFFNAWHDRVNQFMSRDDVTDEYVWIWMYQGVCVNSESRGSSYYMPTTVVKLRYD